MEEQISVVVEEYLLAIQSLLPEGKPIKAVTLAQRLSSSPSTVHATLSRMQRDDLVTIGPKKEIKLTEKGREKSESVARRHSLVENFLCNTLGIPWYEVHKHAHIMEHALTPLVEEKLADFLGHPQTCPHGTPIPGVRDALPKDLFYLHEAQGGDSIEIILIEESLEDSEETMKFLHEKGFLPKTRHEVIERVEVTNSLVIHTGESQVTLPFTLAQNIGVIRVTTP